MTVFSRINVIQGLFVLFIWTVMQLAFSSGAWWQRHFTIDRGILAVENRVSLDLGHLPLPNAQLNIAGDWETVHEYQDALNNRLREQSLPLELIALSEPGMTPVPSEDGMLTRRLHSPEQTVEMVLGVNHYSVLSSLSPYPFLVTSLLFWLFRPYLNRKNPTLRATLTATDQSGKHEPLTLDLVNKELALSHEQRRVALANKPLCFYAALLEYCRDHPDAKLCQHQPLPTDLIERADRYYLRLVALGHTIRKRPDFNASIEKMLSEIRAALDELFKHSPTIKARYYPPKALGEGSRSKLHSFALGELDNAQWTIDGR